jgi:hypothetical protein
MMLAFSLLLVTISLVLQRGGDGDKKMDMF